MIKSVNVLFLTLLVSSGWASAQSTTTGGISESTDPARAAEVERKVEELSGQSATGSSATGTQERSSSGAKKKSERQSESGQESEGSSQSSGGASAPPRGRLAFLTCCSAPVLARPTRRSS